MESTQFLSVDLDVHSQESLAELTVALSGIAFDLHESLEGCEGFARYETFENFETPERTMACFVDALEKMPEKSLDLWSNAGLREFSIGIRSGSHSRSLEWRLSPELIARVAALKAEISIVVYACAQVDGVQNA